LTANAAETSHRFRTIHGDQTGINRPMGLAVDAKNGEIWISNYGDHSALAFDSAADGNVTPKARAAKRPGGHFDSGVLGSHGIGLYDTKRGEISGPGIE